MRNVPALAFSQKYPSMLVSGSGGGWALPSYRRAGTFLRGVA